MRFVEGTNPDAIANRVAFIEKTARVRVSPFDPDFDHRNWRCGHKGGDMYGEDPDSRKWCDDELVKLGYVLT